MDEKDLWQVAFLICLLWHFRTHAKGGEEGFKLGFRQGKESVYAKLREEDDSPKLDSLPGLKGALMAVRAARYKIPGDDAWRVSSRVMAELDDAIEDEAP